MNSHHQPRQHPALPARLSSIAGTASRANSSIGSRHWQHRSGQQTGYSCYSTVQWRFRGGFHAIVSRADRCFCEQHNPTVNKASGVTIQNDGIHVDLSQNSPPGWQCNEQSRSTSSLATFTANAKVWIEEVKLPLVLGGEGLLLEQPLTKLRENFTL